MRNNSQILVDKVLFEVSAVKFDNTRSIYNQDVGGRALFYKSDKIYATLHGYVHNEVRITYRNDKGLQPSYDKDLKRDEEDDAKRYKEDARYFSKLMNYLNKLDKSDISDYLKKEGFAFLAYNLSKVLDD